MADAGSFADYFSSQSKAYAEFRPRYPDDFIKFVASLPEKRGLVWDCGTGNGQAAVQLAPFFEKIIATDPSQAQIQNAEEHSKIEYRISSAESSGLGDHCADMIGVAQALHWFRFEEFYKEARRVGASDAFLAAWGYGNLRISPRLDPIISEFYYNRVGPYWPPERRYVDENYATIPFPFQKLNAPEFFIREKWDLDRFVGYLSSWSSVQRYIRTRGEDPLPEIRKELSAIWIGAEEVRWPVFLLAGRLDSYSP